MTAAIRRFDMMPHEYAGHVFDELDQCDDGEWMRYEDYETLLAQRDALAAALRKDLSLILQLCATTNTLAKQLGLGPKVTPTDFMENAQAALAKVTT